MEGEAIKTMNKVKQFKRVLIANRGEIAIRIIRACREMDIRSVAIYSEEDRNTLFREKADKAYQIGKGKAPVDAYLGIDEIIELAKSKGVDAIHPGYRFLAENAKFTKACEEESVRKLDHLSKISGAARYVEDIRLDGMLYGKINKRKKGD